MNKKKGPKPRPDVDRFWEKVDWSGDCWIWKASLTKSGYGQLGARRSDNACGDRRAHRMVWVWRYGPIPGGLCVLHRCDVPACVNPDHLYLGTDSDNHTDMVERGRSTRGERHGMAKLDGSDVLTIRRLLHAGSLGGRLARTYGVSDAAISNIKHRKAWGHI